MNQVFNLKLSNLIKTARICNNHMASTLSFFFLYKHLITLTSSGVIGSVYTKQGFDEFTFSGSVNIYKTRNCGPMSNLSNTGYLWESPLNLALFFWDWSFQVVPWSDGDTCWWRMMLQLYPKKEGIPSMRLKVGFDYKAKSLPLSALAKCFVQPFSPSPLFLIL